MLIEDLKKYHRDNEFSCVLLEDGEVILESYEKGIAPLYNLINNMDKLPSGKLEMADKIIGRAVSFLAIYLNISYVFTDIISETALDILNKYDIEVEYNKIVPYIFNRNKDGQCPMEKSLENTYSEKEAYNIINEFKSRKK